MEAGDEEEKDGKPSPLPKDFLASRTGHLRSPAIIAVMNFPRIHAFITP